MFVALAIGSSSNGVLCPLDTPLALQGLFFFFQHFYYFKIAFFHLSTCLHNEAAVIAGSDPWGHPEFLQRWEDHTCWLLKTWAGLLPMKLYFLPGSFSDMMKSHPRTHPQLTGPGRRLRAGRDRWNPRTHPQLTGPGCRLRVGLDWWTVLSLLDIVPGWGSPRLESLWTGQYFWFSFSLMAPQGFWGRAWPPPKGEKEVELVARGSHSSTKSAVVGFGHQASLEGKFTAGFLGVPRGGLSLGHVCPLAVQFWPPTSDPAALFPWGTAPSLLCPCVLGEASPSPMSKLIGAHVGWPVTGSSMSQFQGFCRNC